MSDSSDDPASADSVDCAILPLPVMFGWRIEAVHPRVIDGESDGDVFAGVVEVVRE